MSKFVKKLWELVDDPTLDGFICWSENGRSFIIKCSDTFSGTLLPLHFQMGKFSSFYRMLNLYGFRKMLDCMSGINSQTSEMEFFHPLFKRGKINLLEYIKRKGPPKKYGKVATAHSPPSSQCNVEVRNTLQVMDKHRSQSYRVFKSNTPSFPDDDKLYTSIPPFLVKLWYLVEDSKYDHVISWTKEHSTVIIKNREKFDTEVLPEIFKHSNFSSFVRQLNYYGFRTHGLFSEFSHPFFQKSQPNLLQLIKRKEKQDTNYDVSPIYEPGICVRPFVQTLWMLVNDPDNNHLISWNVVGDAFLLASDSAFKDTLAAHFKHKNMSSFVRMLNLYGFHKSNRDQLCLNGIRYDYEFHHNYFHKDKEMYLKYIFRQIPGKTVPRNVETQSSSSDFNIFIYELQKIAFDSDENLQPHLASSNSNEAISPNFLCENSESVKAKRTSSSSILNDYSILCSGTYHLETVDADNLTPEKKQCVTAPLVKVQDAEIIPKPNVVYINENSETCSEKHYIKSNVISCRRRKAFLSHNTLIRRMQQEMNEAAQYIKSVKNKIARFPLFLRILWEVVDDPETFDIISWGEQTNEFTIKNVKAFMKFVLHKFGQNSFERFILQLKFYGFRKSVKHGQNQWYEDDSVSYCSDLLKISKSHLSFMWKGKILTKRLKMGICNPESIISSPQNLEDSSDALVIDFGTNEENSPEDSSDALVINLGANEENSQEDSSDALVIDLGANEENSQEDSSDALVIDLGYNEENSEKMEQDSQISLASQNSGIVLDNSALHQKGNASFLFSQSETCILDENQFPSLKIDCTENLANVVSSKDDKVIASNCRPTSLKSISLDLSSSPMKKQNVVLSGVPSSSTMAINSYSTSQMEDINISDVRSAKHSTMAFAVKDSHSDFSMRGNDHEPEIAHSVIGSVLRVESPDLVITDCMLSQEKKDLNNLSYSSTQLLSIEHVLEAFLKSKGLVIENKQDHIDFLKEFKSFITVVPIFMRKEILKRLKFIQSWQGGLNDVFEALRNELEIFQAEVSLLDVFSIQNEKIVDVNDSEPQSLATSFNVLSNLSAVLSVQSEINKFLNCVKDSFDRLLWKFMLIVKKPKEKTKKCSKDDKDVVLLEEDSNKAASTEDIITELKEIENEQIQTKLLLDSIRIYHEKLWENLLIVGNGNPIKLNTESQTVTASNIPNEVETDAKEKSMVMLTDLASVQKKQANILCILTDLVKKSKFLCAELPSLVRLTHGRR